MPRYNVHLYTLYREKYVGIVADDPISATRLAIDTNPDDAEEVEAAEELPESSLVDEIGTDLEAGEIVNGGGSGQNFDVICNAHGGEPLIVPSHGERRLSDRQAAAVLAGLRLLQRHVFITGRNNLPPDIDDVFQNGGTVDALNPVEIDELCLRLNVGGL